MYVDRDRQRATEMKLWQSESHKESEKKYFVEYIYDELKT